MEGELIIGKTFRVFSDLRCVGVKVERGELKEGDTLQFTRGDEDKPMPNDHSSRHVAKSIQIDRENVTNVPAGQMCAIKIDNALGEDLPPCNCTVTLMARVTG